jgi:hypothetical protein
MAAHTVVVWGKEVEITVERHSKSVWIATGDYMGKPIQVQDATQGAAIKRWREAAEYQGN